MPDLLASASAERFSLGTNRRNRGFLLAEYSSGSAPIQESGDEIHSFEDARSKREDEIAGNPRALRPYEEIKMRRGVLLPPLLAGLVGCAGAAAPPPRAGAARSPEGFVTVERPDVFFPAVKKFLSGAWPACAVAVPL